MSSPYFPIPAETTLARSRANNSCPQPHSSRMSQIYGFTSRRPFRLRSIASGAGVPSKGELKITTEDNNGVGGIFTKISPDGNEAVAVLPAGLEKEFMPRHVAVIMDGNVRWARRRNLPDSMGHGAGVRSLRRLIDLCFRWNIPTLTVFAFSYENWLRSKDEVSLLMVLFERVLKWDLDNSSRKGIKLSVIGDLSMFPESIQKLIKETTEKTKGNKKLQLIVAASYSGRYDVVQACRSIAQKVKQEIVKVEDINDSLIEQELQTRCTELPDPDLLIRTSGELRISNFLLWQLAYTELFFVDTLWPDFGEDDFARALMSYQNRHRRFGGRKS